MEMTEIRTARLLLRRVGSGDWQAIRGIWEDAQRQEYAQYDRYNDTSPEAVRARIEKWASARGSSEHMFFAVCLDGKVIGYVALNSRGGAVYELGYCFHSAFHGRGYAKESLLALIEKLRGGKLASRLTAGTALKNLPSVGLLRSVGFRLAGTEQVTFYKDETGADIYFEGGIFELTIDG